MAQSIVYDSEQVKAEVDSIYQIADEVSAKARNLSEIVDECINRGINTEWAFALKSKLDDFNNITMKNSIKLMKQQAAEIETSGAAVVGYSETIE